MTEQEMQRRLDAFCDEILSPLLERLERLEGAVALLAMAEKSDPIGVVNELEALSVGRDLGLPPVEEK